MSIEEVDSVDTVSTAIELRDIISRDPTTRSLFPDFYNDFRKWRESFVRKFGINGVLSYDSVVQGSFEDGPDLTTSAGDIAFTGNWLILGEEKDYPLLLAFRIRNRHSYRTTAPSEIAGKTGLLWRTVDGFTNKGFEIPDFHFHQELFKGDLTLRYGQFSIDSYFDNHKMRSGKRYFLNQAFSDNPAVGFPSYGAGVTTQWRIDNVWDLSAGISNIQQSENPDKISMGFTSTANFITAQAGYNFSGFSKHDARAQLMLWGSNNSGEDELDKGQGASLTLEHAGAKSGERYIFRLAIADGNANVVDRFCAIGWGRAIRKFDHFGMGLGIGRSIDDKDIWQGVAEVYYFWQVTKELVITPDIQLISGKKNDVGNEDFFQVVGGIRAGFNF
ncbi:MAG: carbohydrate porin [Thermodesulfobacteriota bacterium]